MTINKPEQYRKDLEEMDICEPIRYNNVHNVYEFEIELEIINPDWGMPSNFENFLKATGGEIVDFSHISEDSITVYVELPK